MSRIAELFGVSTARDADWAKIAEARWCPFLDRLCLKNRKSSPEILIGTCTVLSGRNERPVVICPHRLLQNRQIFSDCLHLLTLHEPGNEVHLVPEVTVPGGSVDYFLVSVRRKKVQDFVGIELQTLDTTGTVWPERQRFLQKVGVPVRREDVECGDSFGMNWKMTAKTILIQLHHKVDTFENLNKKLVLVLQQPLLDYMRKHFAFDQVREARLGDSMHIHPYKLDRSGDDWQLDLGTRISTDAAGVSRFLRLQASAKLQLEAIVALLEEKISAATLFNFAHPVSDVTSRTEPS